MTRQPLLNSGIVVHYRRPQSLRSSLGAPSGGVLVVLSMHGIALKIVYGSLELGDGRDVVGRVVEKSLLE